MESTWYLFPGQTLENTKIVDRKKALIGTKEAWQKITSHLDRKKIAQEQIEKEEARKKYLKDGSHEMVKNWDNAFEKVHERRIQQLEKKKEEKEEDLVRRFMELRNEQKKERTEYLEKVKKQVQQFQNEDSKRLNSSLLLSEVLYEREKQVEFNKKIKEELQEEWIKEGQILRKIGEDERTGNTKEHKTLIENNKKYAKELREQIKEFEENERKMKEEHFKIGQEFNIKAEHEMKEIKAYEKEMDKKLKNENKELFNKYYIEQQKYKEKVKKENEIEDTIIKIIANGNCRIHEMKKRKEEELRNNMMKIRELISQQVIADVADRTEAENNSLQNALREAAEKEENRIAEEKAYQERIRKETDEYYKAMAEKKKKDEAEDKEIKKWEMLNRLKVYDEMNKYNKEKAQQIHENKLKYGQFLKQQMAENDTRNYEEWCKKQEELFMKESNEKEDKTFFGYADEIIDLAKNKGRSLYPINRVIEDYKTEKNLQPRRKNSQRPPR